MKLRLGDLKRIISEVAVSPSVFKNERVNDPFDRPNIANALPALEAAFVRAVEQNLVLAARDSYNPETRELDDATYQHIRQTSTSAGEVMLAAVHKAVQAAWKQAMAQAGKAKKKAA